jgi:hypothetical protein
MPEKRLVWPIGPLCRLSGEDTLIILHSDTDTDVAAKFAAIGLMVLLIFGLSVYSSVHFLVNMLNGSYLIAFSIGLFWGCMIANIYYLLLFTVTPPILKGRERADRGLRKEVTTERKLLSRISLVFRLIFVILLAMVIAQPLLVTIFDTSRWIKLARQEYRREFIRLADNVTSVGPSEGNSRLRLADRREIDRLLSSNNFYTRRIQLINSRYPISWLVTLIVVSFFIVPIGLKYRIRSKSNFYEIKKGLEEDSVLQQYEDFKVRYARIFADQFQIITQWYESCTDPPFNTSRKDSGDEHRGQQQLLDLIYANLEESENNKYLLRETDS